MSEQMTVRRRVAAVVILFFFMAGCVVALAGEIRPFLLPAYGQPDFFQVFANQSKPYGFSTFSKNIVARDCTAGMLNASAEGFITPEKYAFIDRCRTLAADITAAEPVMSAAWIAGAYAAILRLDTKAFNEGLAMSQKTSPREQWLAERRAMLGEDRFGWLSDDGVRRHKDDLALLAQSYVGSAFLARKYSDDPSFRERITQIVEQLPPQSQRLFLGNVRRISAQP